MISITVPNIFFNIWFWYALMAIVIAIHFFWGKTPSPPKPSKFFAKHKKTINRIMDVCIILFVLLFWLTMMSLPIGILVTSPYDRPELRAEFFHFALQAFLISAISASGLSGAFIGFLSTFQSNLTKVKRSTLLIISLLPIVFTILLLLINHTEKPEDSWLTIKSGLGNSLGCWIINGPAIILGKHFFRVAWTIGCALRLVSGDYPG